MIHLISGLQTSVNLHVWVAFLLSSLFLRVRGTILPGRGAMSSMSSTMLLPWGFEERWWGSRGDTDPSCSNIPPLVILHSWFRLPISCREKEGTVHVQRGQYFDFHAVLTIFYVFSFVQTGPMTINWIKFLSLKLDFQYLKSYWTHSFNNLQMWTKYTLKQIFKILVH